MPKGATPLVHNGLLASLPDDDFDMLRPLLSPVSFRAGEIILARGRVRSCTFVESGIISLIYAQTDMAAVEVGMAGAEGLLGFSAVFGIDTVSHSAMAVTGCTGWQIEVAALRPLVEGRPGFRNAIFGYANDRLMQAMRLSACHLQHRLEQRLAAWIKTATNLLGSDEVAITHKRLAKLAGVTRSTATLALQDLEGKHAIWSRRNRIVVRDRATLHLLGCACYTHQPSAVGPADWSHSMTAGLAVPSSINVISHAHP